MAEPDHAEAEVSTAAPPSTACLYTLAAVALQLFTHTFLLQMLDYNDGDAGAEQAQADEDAAALQQAAEAAAEAVEAEEASTASAAADGAAGDAPAHAGAAQAAAEVSTGWPAQPRSPAQP